jgi:hypothetical protein
MAVTLALAKQIPFVIENQQLARWAQNEFMGTRLPVAPQGADAWTDRRRHDRLGDREAR